MMLKKVLILVLFLINNNFAEKRVVGYYPQWIQGSFPVNQIDFNVITHVIHSFAWPNEDGSIDYYAQMLDQNIAEVVHQNNRKILLAFGGWGNTAGFPEMVANSETRQVFITNLLEIFDNYGYDGIDIDWEYPSNTSEKTNLTLLVQEMRAEFDSINPDLMITMAVGPSDWSGQHFEYEILKESLDWFSLMGYDFHGSWSNHAGHNAPLYQSPPNDNDGSVHTGVNYLVNTRGISPGQINLGVPFYGKQFNASEINGSFTGNVIDIRYSEIIGLINSGYEYYWDSNARCPYIIKPDYTELVSFDNPSSISEKANYVKSRSLGGMMIWALGYDFVDGAQGLVESIDQYYLSNDMVGSKILPNDFDINIFPNPFNDQCIIKINTSKSVDEINIYSLDGNLVKKIGTKNLGDSKNQFTWSGKDNTNQSISSGVYLVSFNIDNNHHTRKILFLK